MHAFLMPFLFLMVHNTVDFSNFGAPEAYSNILNRVVTDYVEILENHNNLKLINRWGEFNHKIHKIGLQYESYDPYTVDDARTMMIGLIDSVLDAMNRSQRLRQYAEGCSFTPDNVEIRVNFVNDSCSYPAFNQIQAMNYIDGVITYSVLGSNCLGQSQLKKLREEPLDFARRLASPLMQYIPPQCRPLESMVQ